MKKSLKVNFLVNSKPLTRFSRKLSAGLFLLLVGIALLSWRWVQSDPGQPMYQGKSLRYWAEQYQPSTSAPSYLPVELTPESEAAVRQIGTNALPILVRWLTYPKGGIRERILDAVKNSKNPLPIRRMLLPLVRNSYAPTQAILVFRSLGVEGRGAIPSLVALLQEPRNSITAFEALCAIGSQATGPVSDALFSISDATVRGNLILNFRYAVTPDLEPTYAPLAVACLKEDPAASVRMSAAQALGFMTNSGALAVPALVSALRDRDGGVRFSAAQSLTGFGAEAACATNDLEILFNDSNPQVREYATNSLAAIRASLTSK